jgi:hypothetical protein
MSIDKMSAIEEYLYIYKDNVGELTFLTSTFLLHARR